MRLYLSRAEASDFDQLVGLAFDAFRGDPMTPVFFGQETPASLAYVKQRWVKDIQGDSSWIWIKVEDLDADDVDVEVIGESGMAGRQIKQKKIVGACSWKVTPMYIAPKQDPSAGGDGKIPLSEFDYQPTEQHKKDAQTILSDYMNGRVQECREAHLLCSLLFVNPTNQGKGVGTMLMKWGIDVADALMLSCWLESSQAGEKLYAKLGFEVTSRTAWDTVTFGRCPSVRMRRKPAVVGMEGKELRRVA